jgi:hypothetical protein
MKRFGGLRKLLFLHGLATLAAAVGLAVLPGAIPAVAGIHLDPGSYLIAYGCIVFHGASVVLEAYVAYGQRENTVLWINIAVRIIIIGLFAFFARKRSESVPES